ncbi:hypothetical protein D3C71_1093770 [compost metagenome]
MRLRADQALFFAAPQRHADGALGLGAHGLEDAHGFHHHRHAGRVVGRTGAGVPGIHVRAEHDDLVGLAAATDLGQRVVAGLVGGIGEAGLHVDAKLDRFLLLDRPHQRVVVLGHHRQFGHADRLASLARTAAADADDAVVPATDADRGQHALFGEEGVGGAGEFLLLQVLPGFLRAVGLGIGHVLGHGEHLQFGQAGVIMAVRIGLAGARIVARVVEQQDLAGQLALVLVQVGEFLDLHLHHLALHRARGARRPRLGQGVQRCHARAEHLHAGIAELPAATECVERLVVHVDQAPLAELAPAPAVGLGHGWGIGQTRADPFGEVAEGSHHLRAVERLLADAADHVQVHGFALLRHGIATHRQRNCQHAPLQHIPPRPFGLA